MAQDLIERYNATLHPVVSEQDPLAIRAYAYQMQYTLSSTTAQYRTAGGEVLRQLSLNDDTVVGYFYTPYKSVWYSMSTQLEIHKIHLTIPQDRFECLLYGVHITAIHRLNEESALAIEFRAKRIVTDTI